jgi:hypothetical protein
VEVQAESREEGFQVLLVDIHPAQARLEVPEDHKYLADNPENPVVVIHRQDFQADVNQVVQVDLADFHRDKALPVDIPVDVPPFPFRVVNQQIGLVQERAQVVTHPAVQVEDFHQDQVVDILAVDLVRKDLLNIRAEGQESQKGLVIPVDDREDSLADRLLEVIPVEYKNLEVQEADILVEGQGLDIRRMVKDLIVVQVLKDLADQADIRDREDQADLKVLEVSKAQVEHLAAATLVLDQEAIQVDREHKNQAVTRVVPALKDRVGTQAVQASKGQEGFQVDQVRKDQVDIQAGQVHKDQEVSQVDQVRKDQADFQLDQAQ